MIVGTIITFHVDIYKEFHGSIRSAIAQNQYIWLRWSIIYTCIFTLILFGAYGLDMILLRWYTQNSNHKRDAGIPYFGVLLSTQLFSLNTALFCKLSLTWWCLQSVPWATIVPPPSPPLRPKSIIQSAHLMTSRFVFQWWYCISVCPSILSVQIHQFVICMWTGCRLHLKYRWFLPVGRFCSSLASLTRCASYHQKVL